jgi:dimethylargininase
VPGATLDGGDILVTPWHIFAGQSQRTNSGGTEALKHAFQGLVNSINPISVGGLHLKCVCTWAGHNSLLITDNDEGWSVRDAIRSATDTEMGTNSFSSYDFITVPNESEANVVWVNGTLLVPSERAHTQKVLQERNIPYITVPNGEISKADGSTTCCSVLLTK